MNDWVDDLERLLAAGEPVVLVTIAGIRGSAPREVGAKMLVTRRETIGTIGGGQLEYRCARIAFELLGGNADPELRRFPLGPSMGQCCGGVVDVLFESLADSPPGWLRELCALSDRREAAVLVTGTRPGGFKAVVTAGHVIDSGTGMPDAALTRARVLLEVRGSAERGDDCLFEPIAPSEFTIAVFGAGHVGCAVVRTLSGLDCSVRWIDSRRNVFPDTPAAIQTIETADPALEVAALPPGSFYLVMTHSHALDFDICDRILRRGDAAFCGLIGSKTKRRRFEKRLRALGMPDTALTTLVCPIGIAGIRGKRPAEIAIGVTAQMLEIRERSLRKVVPASAPNVTPIRS